MKPNEARSQVELAAARLREHVVDPAADSASTAARRRRFVEAAARPAPRVRVPVLVAAALAAAVVVFVTSRQQLVPAEPPLTFTAGVDPTRGEVGAYFASANGTELPLRFSDGSVMTLDGSARARVTETTPVGATVLLETGRAKVDIVHKARTEWRVTSGPYTIRVTGTSFAVSWEPAAGALEVVMFSGTVVVKGPGIESGVAISGSQRFVTSAPKIETLPDPTLPAPDVAATTQAPPAAQGQPAPLEERPKTPTTYIHPKTGISNAGGFNAAAEHAATSPPESWTALSAKGQHQRVLEEAERRGIDSSLDSASEADLSALADAARYSGRAELARRALLAVRTRFTGSPRAQAAAFLLGRMMEDAGLTRGAVEWYDRYLGEAPRGPLAAETLGRRMVALRHLGDMEACRKAAHDYLRQFPSGPYAGVAGEIAEP
jgi:hypothetical protein